MQNNKTKRGLKIVLLTVLLIAIIGIGILYSLFHNELATLNSIQQAEDAPFFTMTYYGDYGFDDFLQQGASTDQELVDFITKRLLKGIPMNFDLPDLGCSTFSVQTPAGEQLFGRNFDMYYSPALFVWTEPQNGYRSISMVNLSYIGFGKDKLPIGFQNSIMTLAAPYVPLDGINEKGVAVGVLLIDTEPTNQQTDKIDITTSTAIRLILDKAANVEEALDLLQQYDMHASANSCFHFQIADASGRSVVVEYINHEFSVVESKQATNFLLTPGAWYHFGKGQDRYQTLVTTLAKKNNTLTETEAMQLLQAVSQKPDSEDTEKSSTQWSVIYNLSQGTAQISIQRDYDRIYEYAIRK